MQTATLPTRIMYAGTVQVATNQGWYVVTDEDGKHLAMLNQCDSELARTIVNRYNTAPELLAALTEARNALERIRSLGVVPWNHTDIGWGLGKIDAAIASATT